MSVASSYKVPRHQPSLLCLLWVFSPNNSDSHNIAKTLLRKAINTSNSNLWPSTALQILFYEVYDFFVLFSSFFWGGWGGSEYRKIVVKHSSMREIFWKSFYLLKLLFHWNQTWHNALLMAQYWFLFKIDRRIPLLDTALMWFFFSNLETAEISEHQTMNHPVFYTDQRNWKWPSQNLVYDSMIVI